MLIIKTVLDVNPIPVHRILLCTKFIHDAFKYFYILLFSVMKQGPHRSAEIQNMWSIASCSWPSEKFKLKTYIQEIRLIEHLENVSRRPHLFAAHTAHNCWGKKVNVYFSKGFHYTNPVCSQTKAHFKTQTYFQTALTSNRSDLWDPFFWTACAI